MKHWLLDTGPIVAYLNVRDANHRAAVERLDNFHGYLSTTTSVINEAMYFLMELDGGPAALVAFLKIGRVQVFDYCQTMQLERAVTLMAKYADTPMDFADATLVLLADALSQDNICTIDRRGFNTFRTPKGKRFTLVMDEA